MNTGNTTISNFDDKDIIKNNFIIWLISIQAPAMFVFFVTLYQSYDNLRVIFLFVDIKCKWEESKSV